MASKFAPAHPDTPDSYQARAIAEALAWANHQYPGRHFGCGDKAVAMVPLRVPRLLSLEATPEGQINIATVTFRRQWGGQTFGPWYFERYHAPSDGPLVPQTHFLKCHPEAFHEVWQGTKNFEMRFNDRGYQEGDTLVLQEYCPGGSVDEYDPGPNGPHKETGYPAEYTGRELRAKVTYMLTAQALLALGAHGGLQPGWVVLALELE